MAIPATLPSLAELALKHGTDKQGAAKTAGQDDTIASHPGHQYAAHYAHHFHRFRHLDRPLTVLELGVGGYDDPHKGGESLRMWKEYFGPRAQIIGLDWYDKQPLQEDRVALYQGSQDDAALLARIHEAHGDFDLIIDDGSHCNNHVVASLKLLWPMLKTGGVYAIEDLQTSYWKPIFGGSSTELSSPATSMGFLKALVDGLNHAEFDIPNYQATAFDKEITGLHFYHNLAFLDKGVNEETSNVIGSDHKLPEFMYAAPKQDWAT